jgi:hypothetical protein
METIVKKKYEKKEKKECVFFSLVVYGGEIKSSNRACVTKEKCFGVVRQAAGEMDVQPKEM